MNRVIAYLIAAPIFVIFAIALLMAMLLAGCIHLVISSIEITYNAVKKH